METACCGMSLYRATYVILYIHLILNIIGMLLSLTEFHHPLFGVSPNSDVYFAVRLTISVIEFTIFWVGVLSLKKGKSCILISAMILLAVDSCLSIYSLCTLDHETLRPLWKMAIGNENLDHKISDKKGDEELQYFVEVVSSCVIGLLYALMGGLLIFKIYSLTVIYYYKAELKLTHLNDVLIESSAYENTSSPPPYHLLYPNDSVCTSQVPGNVVLPSSTSKLVVVQENRLNER